MKRYISILLTLCMAVSFAVPAFASESAVDMDVSAVLSAVTDIVAAEDAEMPEEPAETEMPQATEAPAETEAPEETETPDETEEPVEADVPEVSEIPVEEVTAGEAAEELNTAPYPIAGMIEGTDITWVITEDLTLTITGTGPLPDYLDAGENGRTTPWGNKAKHVVIDEGITRVGDYSFYFCDVQSVTLPSTLESIGKYAFALCWSVDEIVLPEGLKTIEEGAFMSTALESIVLPEGLETIGARAFQEAGEETLVIPASVTSIGEYAFGMNSSLTSVTVEEGITSLPKFCFFHCTKLDTVKLPSTLETVGEDCFANCLLGDVTVAAPEGYGFDYWYDEDGYVYFLEDMATDFQYGHGDLSIWWYRIWTGFEDVSESAWYYDYVVYCYENGLMDGMGDGTFEPYGSATRGQVVTVLYRLAGEPEVTGGSSFTDVHEGAWYYDAVAWAASEGIAQGMGDGTFAPNDYVTREQFVVFLYRYSDAMGNILNDWDERYYLTADKVRDVGDISDWALEAEIWSMVIGLQAGYDNGDNTISMQPGNPITRGELATFLTRYSLDAYYYYCAEIAESLRGYSTDSVTEAFGQPDEKVDVNSTTQNWYYYYDCLGMEILWHEGYSMWYLNRWWFDY